MSKPTIHQQIESARVLIKNSRDAEILSSLSGIGIDEPYLAEGDRLYLEALNSIEHQSKEAQEQSLAYDIYHNSREQVIQDFDHTFELVKILSKKDTDLKSRLKLSYVPDSPIEVWINHAVDLYDRIFREPDFMTKLQRFKVTTEQLEAQKVALIALRDLRNNVAKEKGEAEQATQLKSEKLKELNDFTRELKDLAKFALGSQSQLLEKLGIRVRSN
ncbi:MAG: hypothetical protein OCD76_20835 [Reichenbachiella sp.]